MERKPTMKLVANPTLATPKRSSFRSTLTMVPHKELNEKKKVVITDPIIEEVNTIDTAKIQIDEKKHQIIEKEAHTE